MNQKILDSLQKLPTNPGVYLMKNSYEKIIYVGKAKNLKNRVRQYFQSTSNKDAKVRAMVESVDSFEFIITDTESEALILENNLIKANQPYYNILLRDDKTHPYVKITLNEDFPRVIKTRKVIKDGAKYFGPYTNASAVNDLIETVRDLYKLRDCNRDIIKSIEKRQKPCLNYYIKKCSGPCINKISKSDYYEDCRAIIDFLEGRSDSLVDQLNSKMKEYALNQKYESAAIIRDRINKIQEINEKQKVVYTTAKDQDYISAYSDRGFISIQLFFVRTGKIIRAENHFFKEKSYFDEDILNSFIKQYYLSGVSIPREILIFNEIEDMPLLSELVSKLKGSQVKVFVPQKGENFKLMNMVTENAKSMYNQKVDKFELQELTNKKNMSDLKVFLGLKEEPLKIESIDISNISGSDSVGAVVVYINGKKSPENYRKYSIKTIIGPDDYGSMREIVLRRYPKLNKSEFPNLILLDGGKGQVSTVKDALRSVNVDIPVFGMYKDDYHKTKGLCDESNFWEIKKHSNLYKFIAGIQEEVHRFAIDFHKKKRGNSMIGSALDNIKGVGTVKKKSLLNKFETIQNIRNATIKELSEVEGINDNLAEEIYNYFNKGADNE